MYGRHTTKYNMWAMKLPAKKKGERKNKRKKCSKNEVGGMIAGSGHRNYSVWQHQSKETNEDKWK